MGDISNHKSKFADKLDELRIQLGLSKVDMAQNCDLTYPFINKLITGERNPSLDTLCKIAYGLKIPFVDVVMLAVGEEQWDEEKGEKIAAGTFPTNPKHKKDIEGKMIFIRETSLRDKYSDYSSDRFREFIERYINDYVYNGVYEEYVRIRGAESVAHEIPDETIKQNENFKKIVQLLSTLTDKQLVYVRKQLQLFIDYSKEDDKI